MGSSKTIVTASMLYLGFLVLVSEKWIQAIVNKIRSLSGY